MNLQGIVGSVLQSVNPNAQIQWLQYLSATPPDPSGASTPIYAAAQSVSAQVQPLPTDLLQHLANLNIQGVLRQVYMQGAVASAVREDGTGGDLLQFAETPGATVRNWLVMLVNEQWNGISGPLWCRVTVRLQNA